MEAGKLCKALAPIQESVISKQAIDSGWVFTWMMVDDVLQAKAWLVTKGFQATDLTEGLVVSSHIMVGSSCALNKWMFWSLDIMNALLQAEGFDRVVFSPSLVEWNPEMKRRVWLLMVLFFGHLDGVKSGTYNQGVSRPVKRTIFTPARSFFLDLCSRGEHFNSSIFFAFGLAAWKRTKRNGFDGCDGTNLGTIEKIAGCDDRYSTCITYFLLGECYKTGSWGILPDR